MLAREPRMVIGAVLLATAVGLCDSSAARTWVIEVDGGGDAETIQAGVDSAAVGDTVLVMDGVYTDIRDDGVGELAAVVMKPGIVLRSQNGPSAVTLDVTAPEPTRAVYCRDCDETTIIEGFTITGGDAFFGAAAFVSGGDVQFRDNVFDAAYGGSGGALAIFDGATVLVDGNEFIHNTACCGAAGAILVESASVVEIRDNLFEGNSGFDGGAIAMFGAGGTIAGNTFIENLGTRGGALMIWNADVTVAGNRFAGNHATTGGGAAAYRATDSGTFEDNVVSANTAGGPGGGIWMEDASPEIRQSSISANSAVDGGGVWIGGSSAPRFDHVIIAANTGNGEIFCGGLSSPSFSCCDVFREMGDAYVGCADPSGTDGNMSEDPLFCDDESLALQECSPCADDDSCGLVGALGVGCECDDDAPARPASWGSIKALYR